MTQMKRIDNDQGNITTDSKDILNIIMEHLKTYMPLNQKT